jgi:hypothetical protein
MLRVSRIAAQLDAPANVLPLPTPSEELQAYENQMKQNPAAFHIPLASNKLRNQYGFVGASFNAYVATQTIRASLSVRSSFAKAPYTFFWLQEQQTLVGCVYFSEYCEGPPGNVHGGCLASIMDDVLGLLAFSLFSLSLL